MSLNCVFHTQTDRQTHGRVCAGEHTHMYVSWAPHPLTHFLARVMAGHPHPPSSTATAIIKCPHFHCHVSMYKKMSVAEKIDELVMRKIH